MVKSSLGQEDSGSQADLIPRSELSDYRIKQNEKEIDEIKKDICAIKNAQTSIQITLAEVLSATKSGAIWSKVLGTAMTGVLGILIAMLIAIIKVF